MTTTAAGPGAEPVSLTEIFLAFAKIGLTAFGGGIGGWMMRDFVQQKRWVTESDFFNGLALSQAFPGTNVVNMAIWIGNRLRGPRGALSAVAGLVGPSIVPAVAIAMLFDRFEGFRAAHLALAGVGAAAIGLSLNMSLSAVKIAAVSIPSVVLIVLVFGAVVVLQVPLIAVVAVAAPIGIASAYWQGARVK